MAKISITRRQHDESFSKVTTEDHEFRLQPFHGFVLEVEDVHFHHDSAVLLADYADALNPERITALAVLASAYDHAEEEPSHQLLIAGHTDTSGRDDYNIGLSVQRADSVLHVLLGNRDDWVEISKKKHKIEDYQQIIKWASWTYGWDCDPGAIDNVHGSKTTAAVKSFQSNYNSYFDADIAEDGVVGTETWGAIFDIYIDQLKQIADFDDDDLADARSSLKFLDPKCVGCGENFPIEKPRQQEYRSKINRRVELLFFAPDQVPQLQCSPEAGCKALYCEIYNPKMYKWTHLPVLRSNLDSPSVLINSLSRWFIPDFENCDIGYSLEGPQTAADKLALEVYASNYSELTDWNDGLPKFRALDNTPVYKRDLPDEYAAENTDSSITDWKGEADCAKGILSKGADGKSHVINVAGSPYTIQFRYYKSDADKKSRIFLAPFWPNFDQSNAAVPASLEVKYAIAESTRLWRGRLSVWDRDGVVVFEKELKKADVQKGEHTFAWDGKTKEGAKIEPGKMPYRVQIQVCTRKGKTDGFALAAAHTEVRIYVHPDTLPLEIDPYVAANDRSSLTLGLADTYHKDSLPTRAADGRLWTKAALASVGFHPGPVNDDAANGSFNTALAEFQRSVPKYKSPVAPPFKRLTISITGNDDEDTKEALDNLQQNRFRPWFGKDADKSDYDHGTDEFRNDFRDPGKKVLVWVNDRNWYSDPDWLQPPEDDVVPTIRSQVIGHRVALGNTRGPYTWGDNRVTQDAKEIARPWIPIAAQFRLLQKAHHLTDILTDKPSDAIIEATRAAIGPLPVDWSFDEIDGSAISVPEVDRSQYHKERTRTRAALEWALDNLKTANYERKDVKAKVNYYNCPTDNGGIRPKNGAGYYKAPFGLGSESLLPWKTADDAAHESIVTVVHDRVGQDADKICAKRRLGMAGVYFHPSRIAGDGYRLRAQVRLEPHAGYDFPNLAILAKRYPKLPQAQTAALRLWRKVSIRGYVSWGNNNNWPGTRAGMLVQHHACHVHIVNELGISDADVGKLVSDFWDASRPADLAAYRDIVKSCVADAADPRRADANIQLSADRIWPWHQHGNLGVLQPIGPNPTTWARIFKGIIDQINNPWYKLTNRLAIELADKLETNYGLMRGHVIVEFRTTPDFWSRAYRCGRCNDVYHYCTRDAATVTHAGAACPNCGDPLQDLGNTHQWARQLPVPSLGDPLGVSYDFDATARLWTHELSHNRYYEHAANAPGANHLQHDHTANPDPMVSADAFVASGTHPARHWDRCCTMTYVAHLPSYDPNKDVAFYCFKCVLKNRGWKLAGVNNPPSAITEP